MTLIAIIKFFTAVFASLITILSGTLIIRHRQLIAYFKSAFTFIREDYNPDIDINYENIFNEAIKTIKFGFKSFGKTNSNTVYGENKTIEINSIIVLIGKLLVITGVLGILTTFIATIWMLSNSQINFNLY